MDTDLKIRRQRIGIVAALPAFVLAGCGGHQVIDPGASPVTQRVPVGTISQSGDTFSPSGSPIKHVPASAVVDLPDRSQPQQYHEVRPGETLSGIARARGISLERLLESNGLETDAALQPGQLIFLPPAR